MTNIVVQTFPGIDHAVTLHLDVRLSSLGNGTFMRYSPRHNNPPWTPVGKAILHGISQVPGVGDPWYDGYSVSLKMAFAFDPLEMVRQVLAVIYQVTGEEQVITHRLPTPEAPPQLTPTPPPTSARSIRARLRQLTTRREPKNASYPRAISGPR